jgi:phosphoglucosamine mutase
VVGTLMTNFALERALAAMDIPFLRAKVGDRYVLEEMQRMGWQLGGENSGHIVCLDKHTTGDGIVSALQVLHAMRRAGATLQELTAGFELYPQILVNVRVPKGFDLSRHRSVGDAVRSAEADLADSGRVLLRPSGTEPLLRVMVEGRDAQRVGSLARDIASAVERAAA